MAINAEQILLEYKTSGTQALLANNKEIIDSLQKMANNTKSAFQQVEDAGKTISQFGRNMQWAGQRITFGLGLPLAAVGTQAFNASIEFDKAMRNVRAAAGDTGKEVSDTVYQSMVDKVKEVSKTTTIALNDVAQGYYELVSAGLTVQQSMDSIGLSAKFAEAANIDMATSTQFAAQMMKVFGDGNHDLTKLMDITSIAVQKSQAHFGDFIHNVQMSASFAKDAGQSYEQLAAALMVLADRGIPAATAGNNLRQALSQMIKPSQQAADMWDQVGVKVYDANGNFKALNVILSELREKTKNMTEEERNLTLQTLFNIRAGGSMRTLLQLTNEEYDKYLGVVGNASGTTMQLAGVVENSQSGAWQNFKNKLNVLNVDIGTKLNPTFQALIDKVIAAANWFTNLDAGTQQHIITAGLLVIALGPVLSTFGAFTQVIGGTLQILGGLTKFIFETLLPALVGTEKAAALTKLALQGLGMTVSIVIVAASVYAAVEAVKSLIGYMQELRNLENTRQQEKDQIDSIYRRAKQEEDMGNKDKAAQLRNIANKAANAAGYYNVTNANPLVNFGMVKKHTGGTIRANSGVLIPGASPLRDRVPVMAEGGEGIMSRKAIENLLQNGVMPQGPQKVNNINFYVSQLLATPGEARAFARKIKELIDQDDSRYAGGLAR